MNTAQSLKVKALHYISRIEDFQKAITNCGSLRVYAIYCDGASILTEFKDYITKVERDGAAFNVWVGKSPYPVTLYLI